MNKMMDAKYSRPRTDKADTEFAATDDPCPDPEAIVSFFFGEVSLNSDLEQHLKNCADCRLKFEALRGAFSRLCKNNT